MRIELRFAMRSLWHRPVYTLITVLTLGIAIGAGTAALSVVNGVFLQPLPYEDPDELVTIWKAVPALRAEPEYESTWNRIGVSFDELVALRERRDVLVDAGGYRTQRAIVSGHGDPEEVVTARATAALFEVLGVPPLIGRTFAGGGDAPEALLSHRLWMEAYGGDVGVLGTTIRVDTMPYTIVGVLPGTVGIEPQSALMQQGAPALWIPVGASPIDAHAGDFEVIGRVRASLPLDDVARALESTLSPARAGQGRAELSVVQRQELEVASLRRPLYTLLGSVGLFLLLACLNVGALTLAEGHTREAELATRVALGASRRHLVTLLLTESAVLALAGTALGVALAQAAWRWLLELAPFALPVGAQRGIDVTLLPYVCGVAALVVLVVGSIPAWTLGRAADALARGGGGRLSPHGRGVRLVFIGAQFALATTIIVSAGLLTRSLVEERSVSPGFLTDGRFAVQVRRPPGGDPTFVSRVRDRLAGIPGVESVALTRRLPLRDPVIGWSVLPQDGATLADNVIVSLEVVSDDYFETMGIPILEGRGIETQDVAGSPKVAVISRALGERLWPGLNPIGRTLADPFGTFIVVGVAADVRDQALDILPEGVLYPAAAQNSLPGSDTFVLRTTREVTPELVAATRSAVRAVSPGSAIRGVLRLDDVVADVLAADTYRATIGVIFAALAAILAAVGLIGLVIQDVSRHMKEFAIRMALGATGGHIARLPLRYAAMTVLIGGIAGALGSLAAGRLLATYLYGVRPGDPITLVIAFGVLFTSVLVALAVAFRRIATRDLVSLLSTD